MLTQELAAINKQNEIMRAQLTSYNKDKDNKDNKDRVQ